MKLSKFSGMDGNAALSRGALRLAFGVATAAIMVAYAPALRAQAIETVTVEARGTEESVRDIPVAITAISQKTMEQYSLNSLRDVANHVPSLEILQTGSGSATSISVRGISASQGSLGIEQDVAIIIDNVYFPQGRAINEGLYDTNQVAILKGPQALYFGKNATAGAISIQTNDPGQEFEAMVRAGYEVKTQSLDGEAMISIPLNDKWGVRLAMEGSDMFGGWMKNTALDSPYYTIDFTPYNLANGIFPVTVHDNPAPTDKNSPGTKNIQGRITLKGQLSDRLGVRLKASYAEVTTNIPSLSELVSCKALNGIPHITAGSYPNQFPSPHFAATTDCSGNWVTQQNPITPDIAKVTPGLNRFDGQMGTSYKSYNVTGEVNYDLDWADLKAVMNYQRQVNFWVCDCGGANGITAVFADEYNTFSSYSTEFRGATKFDGPVNAVVGFYYQHTFRHFDQRVFFANSANSAAADPANQYVAYNKISHTTDNTYSGYGELQWAITDALKLTGGARYISEEKVSSFIQPYVNPAFLGLFRAGAASLLEAEQPSHAAIPEATLTWKATDWATLYVAYKQGWKSGGFDNGAIASTINANPIDDITFDPEKVEGFEGGVKALFADDTVSAELDVFSYKYTNLQLNFFNADTFAYITLNAGGARTTGAEFQVTWAPKQVEGLTLSGSIAYDDAHYTSFTGAPCASGETAAEGCTGPGRLKTQDLSGQARNLAPKWAGSAGFDYTHKLGNDWEWGIAGNVKWKSRYSLSEFQPGRTQSGYAMFDAALHFGDADGHWQFSVIGQNLTNKYVLVGIADSAQTGGNTGLPNAFPADLAGYPLMPRTVKFELTYRY